MAESSEVGDHTKIFKDKTFLMTDYDNNLEKQILKLGGRLLLSHIGSNKMDIDYMVSPIYDSVPISAFGFTFDSTYSSASKPDSVSSASKPDTLSSASKPAFSSASNSIPCSVASINRIYIVYNTTIKERVNKLFIDNCDKNKCLVPVKYYHKPIQKRKSGQPFQNQDCVMILKGYSGQEQLFIEHLVMALGGRYRYTFPNEENNDVDLIPTHLICPTKPNEEMYNAAKELNIFIVNENWLIDCANSSERQDEAIYAWDRNN